MARRNFSQASHAARLGSFLLLVALPALAAAPAPATTPLPSWLTADAPAKDGSCTKNDQCGQGEMCVTLFGSCDEPGKCSPRPTDCKERGKILVKPVCGCDGKAYDNYCLAQMAGVNVKSEGKCPS